MNSDGTTFFERVYAVVKKIPSGRVTTYGHIAEYLGSRGSARTVGWAMNASIKTDMGVPAHRVVNRKGLLTGKHHFHTPDMMQQLLESEGLLVINNQVQNLEDHLWIPARDLNV